MNISISAADMNEQLCKTDFTDQSYERVLDWPGDITEKRATSFQLRPGLKLLILDFKPSVDTVICFDVEEAQLIFGYLMLGSVASTMNHGLGRKVDINANAGFCGISFLPDLQGVNKYPTGNSVSAVHIEMDPALLNYLIEEEFADIPPNFRAIAEGSFDQRYYRIGTMNASMQTALYQMLNCPYQGLTKRLLLESKALELIALQLEQLVLINNNRTGMPLCLRPADIERVHGAKDILINNIQKPPSLMELARQTGLNDFKLKKGFRQVFGKTVFGFLHEYRMEQSRKLLEEGKMNVKEVSYIVGYMNAHSFSDAFKKRYGIRPSNYQKGSDFSLNSVSK